MITSLTNEASRKITGSYGQKQIYITSRRMHGIFGEQERAHNDCICTSHPSSVEKRVILTYAQVAHDSCVVTVVDPLSPRQTRWQFSAVYSCVVALGEPLSPRWTRWKFALSDSYIYNTDDCEISFRFAYLESRKTFRYVQCRGARHKMKNPLERRVARSRLP